MIISLLPGSKEIERIIKARLNERDDFVGHIGGDDFIVVTTPGKERIIAEESILEFERLIHFHYSKEDRERGFITIKDRRGNTSDTPLMSISIAIVNNKDSEIKSIVEWIGITAEIKRYLKTLPGSNFLVNRRVSNVGIGARSRKLDKIEVPSTQLFGLKRVRTKTTKPLGQILLESGVINEDGLILGLRRHWDTGLSLGQSLIEAGVTNRSEITKALEQQMNVPHFNIKEFSPDKELIDIIRITKYDILPLFVLEEEFKQLLEAYSKLSF